MTGRVDADPRPDQTDVAFAGGRLGWLVGVWGLVVAFACVAWLRSRVVGIGFRDPHGEIFTSRVAISLGLFVVLSLIDAWWRTPRGERSVRRVRSVLRGRWAPRRLLLALSGLLAYHLVYFCYHNLKSWDAFNRVQDGLLAHWDRILFFGHTPAVLLHQLLGQHLAAYVLMVIYESFSTLITVAVVAAVVFPTRIRDSYVFLVSGMWVWILGLGSYYLIPSLGPFHHAPQDFSGLPHTMIQHTQATYMAQRAHLLADPQDPHAFAQVSAFASLHVAVTSLMMLMARHYGLRRVFRFSVVWLAITAVATVYLGWHFAVDDLAGLAIAFVAVFLGKRMVLPRRRPAAPEGSLVP